MRQIEGNHRVFGELANLDNEKANEIFDNNSGSFSRNCKKAGFLYGDEAISMRVSEIEEELSTIDDEITEAEEAVEEAQGDLDDLVAYKKALEQELADIG